MFKTCGSIHFSNWMCEHKAQILKTGKYHFGHTGYSPVLAAPCDLFRSRTGKKYLMDYT